MRVAISMFGRELLAVDVAGRAAPPGGGDISDEQAAAPEQVPFGFWGGSGGIQEHSWQPDARRPIDTGESR